MKNETCKLQESWQSHFMDIALIERFLQAMTPPAGKTTVTTAFDCMKAHPMTAVPTIGVMIGKFQHQLYSPDENDQARAMRLVLTGVMLAWATENPELRKYILEDYLEQSSKLQGENI